MKIVEGSKQCGNKVGSKTIAKGTVFRGVIGGYHNRVFLKGFDCIVALDGDSGTWVGSVEVECYVPVVAELHIIRDA